MVPTTKSKKDTEKQKDAAKPKSEKSKKTETSVKKEKAKTEKSDKKKDEKDIVGKTETVEKDTKVTEDDQVLLDVETEVRRILNQPSEPEFKLKVTPGHLKFEYVASQHCSDNLHIENITKERQAFKIKTTSNNIFKMHPAVGFIEPGMTVHIRVSYTATSNVPPKPFHHVVVFHKAAPSARTYSEAFQKGTDGVLHVWCTYKCLSKINVDDVDKEKEKD